MASPARRRWRRTAARLLLVCLALVFVLAALALPYAGRFLIIDDPVQPADAIVVLDSRGAERWLEAVDLYREKMARHLVLSPGIIGPAEVTVRQMGIRYPAQAELVRDAMTQLGVAGSAIVVLPRAVDNTAEEAAVTRPIVMERGWTSIIVVTSKYHTRRTRFAFQREFAGTGVQVQVKGSRHDEVRADGWWRSRSDLRYVISELQKLAAYRLGLRG